jgi:hypothetical protein
MINKGIDIKHPKLRGEWAELRFMARAAEHGLRVTKPWGETARYDFAVEHDGHFLRVQVKSTTSKQYNSYACNLRTTHQVPYCKEQIDFIAAYIIPLDVWYIIPVEIAVKSVSILILSPHLSESKYAPYKEAWHLLCGKMAKRPRAFPSAPAKSETSARAEDPDSPAGRGIDEDEGEDEAQREEPETPTSSPQKRKPGSRPAADDLEAPAATSESASSQWPASGPAALEVSLSRHHSYIQRELERISRLLRDRFS